ncbi:hypothetical protein TL16_g05053 [Triparma laevis f. inornata]|uniref:Ankyrin repeat domain-containing protein n=2 Tax=Triparma laevis TaxID=1534972 RepID=A0A9W7EEE4_9STRA|nr:hypothetical protein TL16_g05053 [Triparma laevis f. inornata]GMH75812.1 hypothetical protein TrLO_g15650 [Triparma laevis f. longispina]
MNFTTLLFLFITIILSITPTLADPDQDLLKSVHQGNIPGIKAAVLAGAMVNKRGSGGQTPLMAATLAGQTEVVRHLLDVHHANPAIPEKDGYTPMHGCCFQGRAEVCKVLIAHGINPRERHSDGYEPAFRATWGKTPNHVEALKVMLTAGKVPLDAMGPKGETLQESAMKNPLAKKMLHTHEIKTEEL